MKRDTYVKPEGERGTWMVSPPSKRERIAETATVAAISLACAVVIGVMLASAIPETRTQVETVPPCLPNVQCFEPSAPPSWAYVANLPIPAPTQLPTK